VTTFAVVAVKDNVGATVHSETVIIVVHLGTRDGKVRRGTDIEGVGVVTKSVLGSAFRKREEETHQNVRRGTRPDGLNTVIVLLTVVNGDVGEGKSMATADGKSVHWRTSDGQTGDRTAQFAESDKLGLVDTSIGTLAIPVKLCCDNNEDNEYKRPGRSCITFHNERRERKKIMTLTGPLPLKVPLVPSILMLVPPMVTRSLSSSRFPLANVMVPANECQRLILNCKIRIRGEKSATKKKKKKS